MTSILFEVSEARASSAAEFDEVFLWNETATSTFQGPLKPSLTQLGQVKPLNSDFVRIALAVLAADRSVLRTRGGSDWNKRLFDLTVAVDHPDIWTGQATRLAGIVGFLTGDAWSFTLVQSDPLTPTKPASTPDNTRRAVLLSGGADSATGALMSRHSLSDGEGQILISQFSQPAITKVQKTLATEIERLVPGKNQTHHRIQFTRKNRRMNGTEFKDEWSTRSRSILFLALGLAAASATETPLWIPENGFASLNPPLGPERRGSLSTKTTHPKFLADLRQLLTDIGAHGDIVNPYERMTKGEMFRSLADTFGDDVASAYLSKTNSCSHADGRWARISPGSSCGVCFGCLVRRASFHAAGLADRTTYLSNDQAGKSADYVKGKSIEVAMRDFVSAGISDAMIMAMDLPDGYSARDAHDLCVRGVAELAEFLK
ncbi:hypothetical protein [Nocardia ignorata]|uniref:7-cyano-7-deazaguanine synthase in queuosine biosynthesis n=1 Tax=Nocardia ignorata TaxID=145285 RepID=A0A4R6P467_NOCIG|nr:hypothetical protein [Nocardia ignorata]TDP31780.1 7-cyano-7-deazaguanine synthase in queuosine biosynthesis [Nocardia ignorata]